MDDLRARIYRAFDPRPLGSEDMDLYVALDDVRGNTGVVRRLAERIYLATGRTCQLLAGHRGGGKSTELRRLQRELAEGEPRFFVVFCQSDDDIDRNDVDFPEVLIAVVRQMAAQLKDREGISLKPGYFKDRLKRLKSILGSEVSFDSVELDVGLVRLSGGIKGSPETRARVREMLEPDTSNLLFAANDLISKAKLELQKKGYRDLVILVDDLDKMVVRPHPTAGCSTAAHLFINREAQLAGFECHTVYTIPLALAYSAQEQTIANLYGGHVPVIPMIKVRHPPPTSKPYGAGVRKLREIIAKRLTKARAKDTDLFRSDQVRDKLIKLSGGQPREIMIMVREAIISGELPITDRAIERAVRESRRAYARQLRAEHWPIIEQVKKSGTITRTEDNDELIRDLLDSRAVLQYMNDREWYDVNPVVADLKPPTS